MSDKKAIKSFMDLDVYQRAYNLSLEIHKATMQFPKHEQYGLGEQIRRASKSICANIAEGFGKQRFSSPEFRRFLTMAIGSSEEMKVWTQYSLDLGYVDKDRHAKWFGGYDEISKMLNGLHRNWK